MAAVEFAVLDGSTTAWVTSAVDNYWGGVAGAAVSVTVGPPDSAGYGEVVTVVVLIPFSQVSWLPSPMFLGGNTMTATTVMRRETIQSFVKRRFGMW